MDLLEEKRSVELANVYVSHDMVAVDEDSRRQPGAGEPVVKGPRAVAGWFGCDRLDPDRISNAEPMDKWADNGLTLPDGDADDG